MTRYAMSSVSHGMSPWMYGRVTEEEVPRARQCCSDACVLGYVSMSEEVNIKGQRIKVKHILTTRVFPDPVCAIPIISFPLRAIGQPWTWMAVGDEKPCFLKLQHAQVKNILTKATEFR